KLDPTSRAVAHVAARTPALLQLAEDEGAPVGKLLRPGIFDEAGDQRLARCSRRCEIGEQQQEEDHRSLRSEVSSFNNNSIVPSEPYCSSAISALFKRSSADFL